MSDHEYRYAKRRSRNEDVWEGNLDRRENTLNGLVHPFF